MANEKAITREELASTIFEALEAWVREPILLQRIIDKEDMLEEAFSIIRKSQDQRAVDWLARYR